MTVRLRKLPIVFAIGSMAFLIGSIYNDVLEASKNNSPSVSVSSAQPEADLEANSESVSPVEYVEADVDGVAKSKIEILKKQGQAKAATVGLSSAVFDAREAAAAAMARLIATRKCERMAGSIVAGQPSGSQASCPTDHPLATSTPSGYIDLLSQQTVNELAFLKQLALYARSERQSDPFDLVQVAKVYTQHPDDNVKEQALEIAALLPERDVKEALKVATTAMNSTVSGPLALQALSLLILHRDQDPHLVDKTVTAALKDGGWHVRDAIASQLLPFITPSTRAEFVQILASEPVRSKVALHIRLNLEEFDRMQGL